MSLRQPLRHGRYQGRTRGLLYLGEGLGGRPQRRPVDAVLSRMVAELLTSPDLPWGALQTRRVGLPHGQQGHQHHPQPDLPGRRGGNGKVATGW